MLYLSHIADTTDSYLDSVSGRTAGYGYFKAWRIPMVRSWSQIPAAHKVNAGEGSRGRLLAFAYVILALLYLY